MLLRFGSRVEGASSVPLGSQQKGLNSSVSISCTATEQALPASRRASEKSKCLTVVVGRL